MHPSIPPAFSFVVFGVPKPQGSTNSIGFIRKSGPRAGKVGVRTFNTAPTATWRQTIDQVLQAVVARMGPTEPLDGPLVGSARFWFPRPASHPKTRRTWPTGPPDLIKLLRPIEDSLIGVVIRDDSRIVRYDVAEKDYAIYSEDPRPRAEYALWRLVERVDRDARGISTGR